MQNVSQAWKDNHKELLASESYVDVTLTLDDPDATADAVANDNGAIYISNIAQTINKVDKDIIPYATLEPNIWVLDGNRKAIPEHTYGACGYIGNILGDANGGFATTPVISIDFSQVHTNLLSGITIDWGTAYDEYPINFTISAYNGNTVVATKDVTNNTDTKTVVYMDIAYYDRIDISIYDWCLPYRRPRIGEIIIGVEKTYSKKDIFKFSHFQTVDPISATLPKMEIDFSVDNTDDTYNPNKLEGLSKYLIERQELKVKYGYKLNGNIEGIDSGTFYMSEWDAPQNGLTATFKARDLLEFMTGTYYYGSYNPDGMSLYYMALEVLQDANLPLDDSGSVKWVIDERLKDIYTTAPLPIDTHANCLQMIANAGECVIYQDRQGILHIEKLGVDNSSFKDGYVCPVGQMIVFGQTTELGLQPSREYTLSFYARCDGNYSVFWDLYTPPNVGNEDFLPQEWFTVTSTPKLFQWTFKVDVDYLPQAVLRFVNINPYGEISNVSSPIYVYDIQIEETTDYSINHFNSYSKSEISLSKPLKQVDVPCYGYTIAKEFSDLYNGGMEINGTKKVLISYSGLATSVTAFVSGGTLDHAIYFAGACELTITATGYVTIIIEGKALTQSSVIATTSSGITGETVTVDNPLITSWERALAVGTWVEGYMRNRMTLSSSWRADPRLDALDIVDNENDYNTNKVIMTSVKYEYNGAFRGSGEGRVV